MNCIFGENNILRQILFVLHEKKSAGPVTNWAK
jgi:hypothetical protein